MTPLQCLVFWANSNVKRWQELRGQSNSDEDWWNAGLNAVQAVDWPNSTKASFIEWRREAYPERYSEQLALADTLLIPYDSPQYPRQLRELKEPPLGLFIRGKIPTGLMLAAVGTRRPSPYGRHATNVLIPPLAKTGLTIVSGLAYGIDALCHSLTLDVSGNTVAVLGGGVDRWSVQPTANQKLAERIIANGGTVLSEYPPGTLATNYSFPLRNRIIAGLCEATLVIEAPEKSGALITAEVSAQLSRTVICVPHPITSPTGAGSNRWLSREGAAIATDVTDILLLFPGLIKRKTPVTPTTNPEQAALLELIPATGKPLTEIVREANQPLATIFALITQLELDNLIKDLGSQNYARCI